MEQRDGHGRRASDALFSRAVKIIGASGAFVLVLIAAAFKIYGQSQEFPRVKNDVDSLKIVMLQIPEIADQVKRIDARVAELYCASVPPEKRAGCR